MQTTPALLSSAQCKPPSLQRQPEQPPTPAHIMRQALGKTWSLRGGQLGLRGETGCLHSLVIIIIDQMSTARKGKGHTQTEWHHLKTVLFSGCLHQHASSSCAAELCTTRAILRLQRQPERPPNTEQTPGVRQRRQGLLTAKAPHQNLSMIIEKVVLLPGCFR